MFTKDELAVLTALFEGKTAKDSDVVEGLKGKLGTSKKTELLERFQSVTGWTNNPKEYA